MESRLSTCLSKDHWDLKYSAYSWKKPNQTYIWKGSKDKLRGNVIKPRVYVGKEKEILTNPLKEILNLL